MPANQTTPGDASWVRHTIWWQLYPLGFCGAPIRDADMTPTPRLRKLIDWLDYAVELGASGLLLGPIFASESHGYDSLDQFKIDPRLGSDQDFADFVTACKQRGLRILLDGVFSHVGVNHPDVLRALAEGPDSPTSDFFDIDWDAPQGPKPRVFEGHSSLVRLNHSSDRAVQHTQSVMKYWLDRGIDGWRLDAAYSVPTEFWDRVLRPVRAEFPDAWILGEVLHGDYSQFVADSGVDSVTQYELWKASWSSIKDRNFFELDWALTRHNEFLETFIPNTFIGNHDVTRITSMVGKNGAIAALVILMTVGGIPSIYYGDEQGYAGLKEERIGGDDDVRPPFPKTPSELSDLGQGTYRAHQELIGLRRRNPWLVNATTVPLKVVNERYVYRAVSRSGPEFIEVDIDLTDDPRATIKNEDGQVIWRSSPVD